MLASHVSNNVRVQEAHTDALCLQAMQAVDVPVYDFASHQRSQTETRRVEPADVIVIEGILVLHIPDVCQRLNMKVYVDTDDDVRLARRCACPLGASVCLCALTTWDVKFRVGPCFAPVPVQSAGYSVMWLCAAATSRALSSSIRSS